MKNKDYIKQILLLLLMLISPTAYCTVEKPEIRQINFEMLIGNWQGVLNVSDKNLRIGFRISKNGENLKATMESPDQRLSNIPVDKVELNGDKVVITVGIFRGSYQGIINGDEITGEWFQGDKSHSMNLQKIKDATKSDSGTKKSENTETKLSLRRPQEPVKPYPYIERNVEFKNESAGITLAGILTLTKSKNPVPAVVLVSGTGPQDRDESVFGHKPFLVLADYLTRRNIAVIRYDDRGFGSSGGDYSKADLDDFASDVLSAVKYLKTLKEIKSEKIGIIGHSEGAFVAAKAASSSEDIAFVVMMAGTGLPGEKVLYRQAEDIARAEGADEKTVADSSAMQKKLFDILKRESVPEGIEREIRFIVENEVAKLKDNDKKAFEAMRPAVEAQIKQILLPSMRQFILEDPKPTLMKIKCPVLAICGERDLQISAKENLPAIEQALKEGGNTNYVVKEMPCLNHLFQVAETGAPSEYVAIEETISPAALKTISDWILSVTKKE